MSEIVFAANILVKGMVVLGIAALMTIALKRASAAARHAVWALALLSLLALPFLSSALPTWRVAVPSVLLPATPPSIIAAPTSETAAVPETSPRATKRSARSKGKARSRPQRPAPANPDRAGTETARASLPWQGWVLGIWLAGFALFGARLLTGLVRSRFSVRSAKEMKDPSWRLLSEEIADQLGLVQTVRLLQNPRASLPVTCGFVRSSVLLPAGADGWSRERRRSVLLHELAHVKRRDCLVQFLAQLTCAAHWLNPPVWFAAKELRGESERACDDLVLHAGTRPSDYAHDLLDMARALTTTPTPTLAAVTLAHRSRLEERLLAILNPKLPRRSPSRLSISLAAFAVITLVLPLATLVPSAKARETSPVLSPNPFFGFPIQEVESLAASEEPIPQAAPQEEPAEEPQAEAEVEPRERDGDEEEPTRVDERLLTPVIEALSDPEPSVREQAASLLGDLEDKRAVEALIAAAKDESPEVRGAVIDALGRMEDPRALDTLRTALADENPEVQEQAVWGLGQLEDPRSVDALIEALKAADPGIRETAASSLGKIEDPRAVDALSAALNDESPDVREQVVWALGMIEDPRSVKALSVALKDPQPDVREQAAWALGQLEEPSALGALSAAIGDESPDVREQVVWALGMIQDPGSVEALTSALQDPEPDIREQAAWALGMIQDSRAVDPLLAAINDAETNVREQVVWALGMIQDRRALDALTQALKDEDPDVREQALWAIGMLADGSEGE